MQWSDPVSGKQTGERFQNPIYNLDGNRIGTNQGYGFDFPVSYHNLTQGWQGNRIFYLEGGTLDVLDEIIVAATGNYSKYAGGMFHEVIVTSDPDWVSEIWVTLHPPSSSSSSPSDDGDGTTGGGGSDGMDSVGDGMEGEVDGTDGTENSDENDNPQESGGGGSSSAALGRTATTTGVCCWAIILCQVVLVFFG